MERTWKSLQVSRQHWVSNPNLSEEIRSKIDEIYFSNENRINKTPEEIYQEIIHLKVGKCEICNHDLLLGFPCPGIYNKVLPENPNIYQLKHYEERCKIARNAARNRDNSYLIIRNKTLEMRESSRKVGLKTGKINMIKNHKKYDKKISCDQCNDLKCNYRNFSELNTFNNNVCLSKINYQNWKNPEYAKKISSNLGDRCIPNFIIKNNVKYYKNELIINIINKLDSGEYDTKNFPGWNKRFGEWYYKTENILTGEINKFNNSLFYEKDEELWYYDKELGDYIQWEVFKIKFKSNNNLYIPHKCKCLHCKTIIDPNDLFCSEKCRLEYFKNHKRYKFDFNNNSVFDKQENLNISWKDFKNKFAIQDINFTLLINDFKFYPTFRSKESNDWADAKSAFEQSLVDDNVNWFVYIKFYIDKENKIKPLVCGKSGSLLVNSSGSDISFDYNPNGGPARQFLIEENLEWDKTRIAILKCNSEKEAYEKESMYVNTLNLFIS